jgi:hypothetical protein
VFVEVIRLRAKGERLDRASLRQAMRICGYLNVHQRFDHWARRDVYVATLTRGDFASTEQLLPALDQVRIGKLTDNDFVLLGVEDLSQRKVTALYPQAWWCRARPDPGTIATPFDSGDDI